MGGLGPFLCPGSQGPTHLSDADCGLGARPDAEALVLQEGRVVMPMNHDLDASLRGQQREVVLLPSPEDQANPWEGKGLRPGWPGCPLPHPAWGWHSPWLMPGCRAAETPLKVWQLP